MSAEESQSQDSYNEEISKKKSRKKHHKKKGKKKKHRKISSEEENSNEEENENEEEDEDSSEKKAKSKKNTNLKLPEVKEEPIKKTKDEYIAQIEQLQNELQLEQKISQSLDLKNEYHDELINLQKNLEEKNKKLNQLIKTNKRQEDALANLRRQIPDDENKKKTRNMSRELRLVASNSYKNTFQRNNNILYFNTRKSLDDSKLEAINIVIKIKEKAINNAIMKMNILKKENEILRKELYKNDDYSNNLGLEDNSNENKKRLDQFKDEIKILNGQLEQHKKCIIERNNLEKENLKLKKNLQEIQRNIKQIKSDIKERQKDNDANTNSVPLETNEDNTTVNNNLSPRNYNITKTNINPKNKAQNHRTIPTLNLTKSIEGIKLPLITSPSNSNFNKNEKNILTEEFYNKLKNFYKENEGEYEILKKKIKEIENSRSFIENKHRNEIKQFDSQILVLDKQFKILNNEGKGNGSNIRVLKYKLNIVKNETKNIFNKIQQLKTKIDFLNGVTKEKDFEIFELKAEIEKIRNKCGKKDDSNDSDNIDSDGEISSDNESETPFDSKGIKSRKFPILDLKTYRKKKKKKK